MPTIVLRNWYNVLMTNEPTAPSADSERVMPDYVPSDYPFSDEEKATLDWGWEHVPGLLIGFSMSGKKVLFEAIRKAQIAGSALS